MYISVFANLVYSNFQITKHWYRCDPNKTAVHEILDDILLGVLPQLSIAFLFHRVIKLHWLKTFSGIVSLQQSVGDIVFLSSPTMILLHTTYWPYALALRPPAILKTSGTGFHDTDKESYVNIYSTMNYKMKLACGIVIFSFCWKMSKILTK